MNTLYLTQAEETKISSTLAENLRKGWSVEREERTYVDSQERKEMRLQLMRLKDPTLRQFYEQAAAVKTSEEFAALAKSLDLRAVPNQELVQVFFTLGPVVIGAMAEAVLGVASTADDVELAAALLALRHEILDSFPAV